MTGDRLRHARELSGLTQSELAGKVGVTQPTVAMIERDAFTPSDDLQRRLADATGFMVDYFQMPADISFPMGSLLFRKYARLRAADRERAYRIARAIFEVSENLRSRVRTIPINLPRIGDETPERAARLVRSALGLDPNAPIPSLIRKLERNGVRVFILPEEIPDLDAFSLWAGDIPVIVLNAGRPGDRQRWNVSHEAGHLVMHRTLDSTQEDLEKAAHRFAAELLTPRSAIESELVAPVSLSLLAELKSRWGVSMKSLLMRAREIGSITPRQYRYLQMQLSHRFGNSEPLSVAIEKPRALRKAAEILYGESPSVARIARDTNHPPMWVARILDAHADNTGAVTASPTEQGSVVTFRRPRSASSDESRFRKR